MDLILRELGFLSPKCRASRGFPSLSWYSLQTRMLVNSRWKVWPLASCLCYPVLFEVDEAALSLKPQGRLEKRRGTYSLSDPGSLCTKGDEPVLKVQML